MLRKIKATLSRLRLLPFTYPQLRSLSDQVERLELRVEYAQESLGRIELRQLQETQSFNLTDHEFHAFSQWGEDGIIQFLLDHIEIERKIFVEFGADNYNFESNTRFLLTNNNWAGLVMDGSNSAIRQLKNNRIYWLYNLKAVCAFITRDNINDLLIENGVTGEIGLLSIDLDGNDYWVWRAISAINPVIVIVEYNHRFGPDVAVTIPYDENFDRYKAHPSRLYFGASLKALCKLGNQNGYSFVGCNSNGVNAFFVRNDKKPESIKALTAEEGYVGGRFGERFARSDDEYLKLSPGEEEDFLRNLKLPLVTVD
jgi:hypothetical protein